MLLRAHAVARSFGDQSVFEDVNLDLGAGQRLALIGENGSGKSTLLRVLAGLDAPDAGTVARHGRVALLAQQSDLREGSVLDAVTPPEVQGAAGAFAEAAAALESGSAEALDAFASAEETYRLAGGYGFEARAAAVLAGLDLPALSPVTALSGGQVRRVMLARLLLAPADVFLLDEPTNHLDARGARWLEGWIAASDAAFILASHDRAFLDAVATDTAELERGRLTLYPGPYSEAMALKAMLREAQEREYAAYRRKRADLDEEMRRRASKARSAGSFNMGRASDNNKMLAKGKAEGAQNVNSGAAKRLRRQIERLDARAVLKPFEDRRLVRLDLPPAPLGPVEVLGVRDLSVAREDRVVLRDVTLQVRRGDRVALVGPNGGGKSTFLRSVLSGLPAGRAVLGDLPHGGSVRWGPNLSVYVAGQHAEELRGLGTVGDALLHANPALTPHQLHEVAAQVQLPGPDFPLAGLSGGQRTRLSLVRLNVTRAQVLVLDEPTNHLDIRMIEVLEDVLVNFSGTVLLASHDRSLVRRVATRWWDVRDGAVTELDGPP